MSKEGSKTLWRGVRPTDPESIFTRYEPPDGATYIEAYATANNNTVVIYTVPVDKIFYITSIDFSVRPDAAGMVQMFTRDDLAAIVNMIAVFNTLINNPVVASYQYPITIQLIEAYDIVVSSNTLNCRGYAHIVGYTKDV